jgi:LacI family transcriptional regulator
MARVATPQLTTVRVPMREIGWNAGELLLGLLGEEVATVERELPIELVIRESTGSPRALTPLLR